MRTHMAPTTEGFFQPTPRRYVLLDLLPQGADREMDAPAGADGDGVVLAVHELVEGLAGGPAELMIDLVAGPVGGGQVGGSVAVEDVVIDIDHNDPAEPEPAGQLLAEARRRAGGRPRNNRGPQPDQAPLPGLPDPHPHLPAGDVESGGDLRLVQVLLVVQVGRPSPLVIVHAVLRSSLCRTGTGKT